MEVERPRCQYLIDLALYSTWLCMLYNILTAKSRIHYVRDGVSQYLAKQSQKSYGYTGHRASQWRRILVGIAGRVYIERGKLTIRSDK